MASFPIDVQSVYDIIKHSNPTTSNNFAILKLYVADHEDELLELYENKIKEHNRSIMSNPYPDSGFDLFFPEAVIFNENVTSKFIDFKVKAEMFYCNTFSGNLTPCAFYIHPRSSISKTPLMLANHTGIIDSGYRGNLIGAFRWLLNSITEPNYVLDKHIRLLQVCHPTLCPIYVTIASKNSITASDRGDGGFGSTGV